MADASNTSSSKADADRRWPTPDWDHLPFDVACARCGHSLRGLTEPKCPVCGLESDWSEAVPLEKLTCLHCGYHLYGLREMRCPECGSSFTWEHVLDDYRRRKKPFFEYQWRRRPVRSLVRTWFWALRPSKLWARFNIHDPPQVKPLLALVVVSLLLFAFLAGALDGFSSWFWPWWNWGRPTVGRWPVLLDDLPRYVLRAFKSAIPYSGILVVVWTLTSLAALMVFRQSMRRFKVRTVQVLRVWAHAVPLMLPGAALLFFLGVSIRINLTVYVGIFVSTVPDILAVLVFLFYVTWSLRCGYKTYLRMDHSLAVGIASQLMATLGAVALFDSVGPGNLGKSILLEIDRLVGLF